MDPSLQTTLREALLPFKHLRLALAYGSAAANRLRPDSDLDVAVLSARALDPDERLTLSTALERATGRAVDLCDLATAHGTLLAEVLQRGVQLFVRDRRALEGLQQRFIYEQTDFMPAYRRALALRRERFLA
jgi:predicted nucleotidyltransferase